jgi:predicted DsbA family dithiol-disulfide isomerase
VNWRYFSLEQSNSDRGPDWKIWEHYMETETRGINAFRAAEAVRRQNEDLFRVFHRLLLDARHREHLDISGESVLGETAEKAGADTDRFIADYSDASILDNLARDHRYAVESMNIFGTPTFVFKEKYPVFFKIQLDSGGDPESLRNLIDFAENQPYILEIKRP